MSDRDDLEAARVRIATLEAMLAELRASAPAVPQPSTGALPGLWDHNRRFPIVTGGKAANVVCPTCRAAGQEVQMVRELGAGSAIAQEHAFELEEVTCPRCPETGWMRIR